MMRQFVQAIERATRIVAMTGAGVSAESGLATFRDAQTGLWSRFKAEDLATPEAFESDPDLVWQWYRMRRHQALAAEPNAAHVALAKLEQSKPDFVLITQNVDGLHQRAGSQNVLELHGNIHSHICHISGEPVADTVDVETDSPPDSGRSPNGLARPAVVWFGEGLPGDTLESAWQAAAAADLFLSIGTSSVVEPAASLARVAKANGATIVEINPNKTPLTIDADIVIHEPAAEVLSQLNP